jgi:hypothetical protein
MMRKRRSRAITSSSSYIPFNPSGCRISELDLMPSGIAAREQRVNANVMFNRWRYMANKECGGAGVANVRLGILLKCAMYFVVGAETADDVAACVKCLK